jgi:predicted PurR-regulated permease PerM
MTSTGPRRGWPFWLICTLAAMVVLWVLEPVLLPFVAGLGIAYVLDPPVARLERMGVGRTAGTILVMVLFAAMVALAIALVLPILIEQVQSLANKFERAIGDLYDLVEPYLKEFLRRSPAAPDSGSKAVENAPQAVSWLATILAGFWSGSMAVLNLLSLLFVTPIVAFYMMRDWPKIVTTIDSWLPRDHAPLIREQLREIDLRMSGFLRGQAVVCLLLGIFYAVGLTLAGLNYGLLVGFFTGILSFIPYLGMVVGAGAGLAIAVFQFGDWQMVGIVAGIFVLGQFLEGNFVSPILVGDRVGLHPVWVILAVLAGGALYGVTGVLLSIPVAAAMGVLLRLALDRYLAGPFYHGRGGPGLDIKARTEGDAP